MLLSLKLPGTLSFLILCCSLYSLLPSPPANEDQKRMNRLRRSVPNIRDALGQLHKDPNRHELGEAMSSVVYDSKTRNMSTFPLDKDLPISHLLMQQIILNS